MDPQKNSKVFRLWKIILIPIFAFTVIHFLKDITQDLLGLATVLDFFGDVKEDLSNFPENFVWFYHWFLVNTFFIEIFLLFYIPKAWCRKTFSRADIVIFTAITYLVIAFTWATLLDPRF